MKIKDLEINGITFLAPLAGITNLPFRQLIKDCGCAVVCSEMISAKGIFYNSEKTITLLKSQKTERPLSVQIFGSDPVSMGQAAAFIDDLGTADIIDINFGCSVRKVIKQGAGVALMKDPALARKILKAVRNATSLPFTIKIRSGWDTFGDQAVNLAKIAEDQGVDAIAFHPRSAAQGFRGKADWKLIARLKQAIRIPVIGNGDIITPQDAGEMFSQTGCDAVMVGRAAMANPFILSQIEQYVAHGTFTRPEPWAIFRKMEALIQGYVTYFGETTACRMLRGRLAWFIRGLPGAAGFRKQLSTLVSSAQARDMIRDFEAGIKD
ncbi:tRNA dihydrouridine synthase DusB [Desulfobacter hydrogenophilus]|uniref:tRNA-dihydrouridine synthase n=1 Tax=Desulfobacter hydrogenophilus TaxID=2291 RepID=A0A328FH85_9BACT|nr:tRNA dihydrouridine synthase DusB [Desulfobacter hydrogenophilus]NDY73374.1 tRNA dihydrouridine synthase DusB [Desulfobacter hydrogenophilus]QBH12970.1 tRNA dihydrouridine synthase DusB [Desulfobacter hydrogenophilus]RAM03954.1 tRNA dihydrouridine synthase DusB [Desulfobacter hydrogenophilus]